MAPDDEAKSVLPAVPTEASRAYWVAVKLLSTKRDINVTNATVANAAAKSSRITAKANKPLEGPAQANTENKILVEGVDYKYDDIVWGEDYDVHESEDLKEIQKMFIDFKESYNPSS